MFSAFSFNISIGKKAKTRRRVDRRELNLDGLAKKVKICGLGASALDVKVGERGFSSAPALFEK